REGGVARLDEALAGDGEGEAVRTAVGRAARAIAAGRGRPEPPVPLLRDAEAGRPAAPPPLWARGALAGGAGGRGGGGGLGRAGGGAWAVAVPLALTALLPSSSALAGWGLLGRLERQEVLGAIEGPAPG